VSVIVPAFNAAHFLGAALASVAAQSRPADEVVVIDDGSTDDTIAVARRWDVVLPLVVVEKPVNEGLGAARRDGIANASGELIALLDADDYWLPDHLEILCRIHARQGGIVAANTYRWVPERQLARRSWNERVPTPARDKQAFEILERNFLQCLTLFDRTSYQTAGGFRDLRSDEDWDLWIRMIRDGARVTASESVTAIVRNRDDSLSAGDKFLPFDIAVLEDAQSTASPRERKIIDRSLRRRRARLHLIAGYEMARAGRAAAARAEWLRAIAIDRSLRRPFSEGTGSVVLRALVCILAPKRMVSRRDRRAADVEKRSHPR
jgi:glycosyltransferase involved in cell wall biosynthesis